MGQKTQDDLQQGQNVSGRLCEHLSHCVSVAQCLCVHGWARETAQLKASTQTRTRCIVCLISASLLTNSLSLNFKADNVHRAVIFKMKVNYSNLCSPNCVSHTHTHSPEFITEVSSRRSMCCVIKLRRGVKIPT